MINMEGGMITVICDDDVIDAAHVEQLCRNMATEDDEIYTYTDSLQLYQWLMQDEREVDLFILDIEMPQMDGIELKQQISRMSIDTRIIFLTNHIESMNEAFGRYVIGFVDKGNYEKRLKDFIKEIQDELSQTEVVNLVEDGRVYTFRQKEIIKIEARHVYTRIEIVQYYDKAKEHWVTENREPRISLREWEKTLDSEEFYRINRSLIVNFRNVKRINHCNELEFITGECYGIPVKKRKIVRTAYNLYCMRKARCM